MCVIGGGDRALTQAIYLSGFCKKVYLIHRRNGFRAADYLVKRAVAKDNIEFVLNAVLTEVVGDTFVNSINILIDGVENNIVCRFRKYRAFLCRTSQEWYP